MTFGTSSEKDLHTFFLEGVWQGGVWEYRDKDYPSVLDVFWQVLVRGEWQGLRQTKRQGCAERDSECPPALNYPYRRLIN